MRAAILFLIIFGHLISSFGQCPIIQRNLNAQLVHHKDVNTHNLNDGSNNYVVAGTKFDTNFGSKTLFVTRVDQINGLALWSQEYPTFSASRGFDITSFVSGGNHFLALTGYVEAGALNQLYIMVLDATTGNTLIGRSYVIDPNLNSQGLHIEHTTQLYNGAPTPGFIVSGFANTLYDINNANNSIGFLMRVDTNLLELWTRTTDSATSASIDYDMANNVAETNDGYIISGSSNMNTGNQQAVMTAKYDFDGNLMWTNAYIYGNARDVAADSYYNAATNELYLLTYYSVTHFFGITVLDNATGTINTAKSWYAAGNDLNWTGFTLIPAANVTRPNDLVILGYRQEANVNNPDGTIAIGNSVPFAVSFDRTTNVITNTVWYPVPYKDPAAYDDYFAYWNGQSPLIYHPDIGFDFTIDECYFMVGNRSNGDDESYIETMRLNEDFIGECDFDQYPLGQNQVTVTSSQVVMSSATSASGSFISPVAAHYTLGTDGCSIGGILATANFDLKEIKLFPNPASEVILISNLLSVNPTFIIYDIQGKTLLNGSLTQGSITISELSQGVYFLKISAENQSTTLQFIKI